MPKSVNTAIIESVETAKQARKQRALQELGKVLVNFGSLTFASLVLGTITIGIFTLANSGGQK